MSKEVAGVLRAARNLIAVPERWTSGSFARHSNGYSIGPREQNAACWCAFGAVRAVASDSLAELYALPALDHVAGYDIVDFNDAPTTIHADILACFDRAIAAEEANP